MSTDIQDAEYEVEVASDNTALATMQRGEIDMMISTAKRYPRSVTAFKRTALEMATLDEETAGSMFYALPRGGKKIEGPSVRLAEVVGSCWGNLRYASRIVATEDRFVTAQGVCFDMEKNISASIEVKRRITDKNGKRFNDDMIQVTSQAACSIALREAIFKVVPRAYVNPICQQAKLASIGKAETMAEKRHKMLDWFKKTGATEKQLLDFLGHKGVEDVTIDDLITLRGLATAIKEGEITVEAALTPQNGDGAAGATGTKVSKSDLGQKAATKKAADRSEEASQTPIANESRSAPLASGELARDLSRFQDACVAATMIGEVNKADTDLRGPNGRTLTDDESVLADAWKTEAEQRIRNARGERSGKAEQKSLTD